MNHIRTLNLKMLYKLKRIMVKITQICFIVHNQTLLDLCIQLKLIVILVKTLYAVMGKFPFLEQLGVQEKIGFLIMAFGVVLMEFKLFQWLERQAAT